MLYKIILCLLILLSLITKNKNMCIASIFVLLISLFHNDKSVSFIEKHFMSIGMIFLMIWMLIPIIKTDATSSMNFKDILNYKGIISFASGIIVVLLASKGADFLKGNAGMLTGVIMGSIAGVAFLGGVPVGPLVASGIAYEIIKVVDFLIKHK